MSSKSAAPVPVAGLHAGSKSDFGEDMDIDDMIEKMGCAKEYYRLEDCLGEHDRDWTKCQGVVKELRQCNDRLRALKEAQEAQRKPQ
jgi:cytochrome c oxidase assembly factor 4